MFGLKHRQSKLNGTVLFITSVFHVVNHKRPSEAFDQAMQRQRSLYFWKRYDANGKLYVSSGSIAVAHAIA